MLLTLKFERNAKITKICTSPLVFEIFLHGLNYQLQFERGHAMLILAFDFDLKFKVKYRPKFGTRAKFNSDGRVLVWW